MFLKNNRLHLGITVTSFSKSNKEPINQNKTPGPGEYNANYLNSQTYPENTLSKDSNREIFKITDNPSPADYYYKVTDIENNTYKQYTFSKGSRTSKTDKSPGPGDYDTSIEIIKPANTKVAIKKSNKSFYLTDNLSDNPGPGNYQNEHASTTPNRYTFSTVSKFLNYKHNTPGVGTYNIEQRGTSPKSKFSKQLRDTSAHFENYNLVPGPGNYDESTKSKIYHSRVSITPQRELQSKDKIMFPSCTLYNPKIITNSKGHQFGKERKELVLVGNRETPGPGIYGMTLSPSKYAGVSLRGKPNKQESNGYPGPGSYLLNQSYSSSNIGKFSKDQRTIDFAIFSSKEVPGPGKYTGFQDNIKGVWYIFT